MQGVKQNVKGGYYIKCTLCEAGNEVTQGQHYNFQNSLETSSHLFSILPEVGTDVTFTRTQFGLVPQSSVQSCHLPVMSTSSDTQTPEPVISEQFSHSQPQAVIDAGKQILFCDRVNCTLLPMAAISFKE